MNEEVKMSFQERSQLERIYQTNMRIFSVSVFGVIVGGFLFFLLISKIPADFLGYDDIDGTLLSSIGPTLPLLVTAVICLYIILVLNNEWKITKLKADLKRGTKIVANLKVESIYHIPQKDLEELQSIGHKYTSELRFEENTLKINNYPFNKITQPEFLNAQQLYLERAPRSMHEFKRIVKCRE